MTWLIHVRPWWIHPWHDSYIGNFSVERSSSTWCRHECDMTHSYMTWRIHRDMTHVVDFSQRNTTASAAGVDMSVIWLIQMSAMTHSYVRHDSFTVTYVSWLIQMMSHDTHLKESWHINESWHSFEWVMTHKWVMSQWMSHVAHMNESWHSFEWVMNHMASTWVWWRRHDMCDMTHSNECHDSFICATWLINCDMTHAVEISLRNAAALGVDMTRCEAYCSDMFAALPAANQFDVILFNPPQVNMCACVCMCMCVYISITIYVYTYTYIYISHMYKLKCRSICRHRYGCWYVCIHICKCIYKHIYINISIHIYQFVRTIVSIYIHVCLWVYIHVCVCVRNIHACVRTKVSFWRRGVLVAACVVMCGCNVWMLQCSVVWCSMLQCFTVFFVNPPQVTDFHTWHDSFKCVTCLINIYDMTHSPMTWLIHTQHGSFTYSKTRSHVTWLIHTCDTTYRYTTCLIYTHTWHDSFTYDMTHSPMGWLRWVGALKL